VGEVRVVDHERLAGFNADCQKPTLAVPGLEHVQIDSQVGSRESFPVKRRFPSALQPHEDHGFHDSTSFCTCLAGILSTDPVPLCTIGIPIFQRAGSMNDTAPLRSVHLAGNLK
jgi:hypothetical protein